MTSLFGIFILGCVAVGMELAVRHDSIWIVLGYIILGIITMQTSYMLTLAVEYH